MKTILSLSVALLAAACAYRSPEMYRDDTTKLLQSKNEDIRVCYDGVLKGFSGVSGRVTVTFEIEPEGGKIQKVAVDKTGTNAPDEVAECVKKNIEGLVLAPPDQKTGQAKYVYEFSVPAAAAPKS